VRPAPLWAIAATRRLRKQRLSALRSLRLGEAHLVERGIGIRRPVEIENCIVPRDAAKTASRSRYLVSNCVVGESQRYGPCFASSKGENPNRSAWTGASRKAEAVDRCAVSHPKSFRHSRGRIASIACGHGPLSYGGKVECLKPVLVDRHGCNDMIGLIELKQIDSRGRGSGVGLERG
jgi:hypothetical protein